MARPNCNLISRHSYDPTRHKYSVSGRSETVPDQNYSVRTLLDRFQRGVYPPGVDHSDSMVYDEELDESVIRDHQQEEFFSNSKIVDNETPRDLTDIDTARSELRQIKETEKRKRVERNRYRARQNDPSSGVQNQQPQSPASPRHDGEQKEK